MFFEKVGVSPAGIPVYKTGNNGLVAMCCKTINISPLAIGIDHNHEYAILVDNPFFRLDKKRFESLIGHEEAHALNGDLDGNAPVNEHGIIVCPEFELRADAHGATIAGGATYMIRVLLFVKACFLGRLIGGVILRAVSIKQAWTSYRALREELAPRIKALKTLRAMRG